MDSVNLMMANCWPACVIGLLLSAAAVACTFLSRNWSALLSFVALSVVYFWGNTLFDSRSQYFFWGAASLLAWGICFMLPRTVANSRVGMGYITGAALAGALTGMIISDAGVILGAMLGAFCGAMAYSRTPSGTILQFPSSKFLHYLCAKGLPAVVNVCVFALLVKAVFAL